jgi:hypothetical protein
MKSQSSDGLIPSLSTHTRAPSDSIAPHPHVSDSAIPDLLGRQPHIPVVLVFDPSSAPTRQPVIPDPLVSHLPVVLFIVTVSFSFVQHSVLPQVSQNDNGANPGE